MRISEYANVRISEYANLLLTSNTLKISCFCSHNEIQRLQQPQESYFHKNRNFAYSPLRQICDDKDTGSTCRCANH